MALFVFEISKAVAPYALAGFLAGVMLAAILANHLRQNGRVNNTDKEETR